MAGTEEAIESPIFWGTGFFIAAHWSLCWPHNCFVVIIQFYPYTVWSLFAWYLLPFIACWCQLKYFPVIFALPYSSLQVLTLHSGSTQRNCSSMCVYSNLTLILLTFLMIPSFFFWPSKIHLFFLFLSKRFWVLWDDFILWLLSFKGFVFDYGFDTQSQFT